jgi:hypothetical protein
MTPQNNRGMSHQSSKNIINKQELIFVEEGNSNSFQRTAHNSKSKEKVAKIRVHKGSIIGEAKPINQRNI